MTADAPLSTAILSAIVEASLVEVDGLRVCHIDAAKALDALGIVAASLIATGPEAQTSEGLETGTPPAGSPAGAAGRRVPASFGRARLAVRGGGMSPPPHLVREAMTEAALLDGEGSPLVAIGEMFAIAEVELLHLVAELDSPSTASRAVRRTCAIRIVAEMARARCNFEGR